MQETQSYQRFQHIVHTVFNTSGTNGPRSLSRVKVGTHSAFGERSHTGVHRAKHGAFRMGVVSLPSDCFTRFGNPAWPGVRTANFAALGAWSRVLPKNAESLRNSDALMRVAVPRRRGPAGLRDLFATCGDVAVLSLCAQYFLNVRGVGGITTLGALCVFSKRWTTACQSGYPLLVRLHPSVIRAICNLHNVANITL